jgi:hypothetical protein
MLLILFSCSSTTKPKPDESLGRKAFKELEDSIEKNQNKKDFTGVKRESTGEIATIIDEPDAVTVEKYQTGTPG